jgi:hypothetical protein
MDPKVKLKLDLAGPYNPSLLADYVHDKERHRHEEDTFIRLALPNANVGGAHGGRGEFLQTTANELYDPLRADQRLEIRRWWHARIQAEAENIPELRERLVKVA